LRIIIEDGQTREGQNSTAVPATTFFDPGRSVATNAGPAPKSLEMSTTATSPIATLVDAVPGARVLDAGPPPKSLIELIKSATTTMSISSAYEKNNEIDDIDAGKAPKL
jgi:hypothetical protein